MVLGWVSSVIGTNNDITEEPTIDYNRTIYSDIFQGVDGQKRRGAKLLEKNKEDRKEVSNEKRNQRNEKVEEDALQRLQLEIDSEAELRTLIDTVNAKNGFLRKLNTLADSSPKGEVLDYEQKYHDLRREYLEELSSHQFFYKSYQELLVKYKALRRPSNSRIHEKIRLMRSTSTQVSVKSMCDNVLAELDQQASYKDQLDAANDRIADLERMLKNNP